MNINLETTLMDLLLTLDSELYDDYPTYQTKFHRMARNIMGNYRLNMKGTCFDIIELEFYLSDDVHKDPFIHADEDQTIPGRWYFHRQNGKGYKSGTYKGLDITFGYGTSVNKVYGGILIRSIRSEEGVVIEGPCRVVNIILQKCQVSSIAELVGDAGTLPVDHEVLRLEESAPIDLSNMCCGPRVGLTLKKYTLPREQYLMTHYRFVANPSLVRKFKSGLILALYQQAALEGVNWCRQKQIENYINLYNNAEGKASNYDGKRLKVADLCALQKLCLTMEL